MMLKIKFILALLIPLFGFLQDLLNVAVQDKSKIINQKPFKFKLKEGKWEMKYRMESLSERTLKYPNSYKLTDTSVVVELCKNSKKQDSKNWSQEEFKNVFITEDSKFLNFKEIRTNLRLEERQEIKKLRKQVNSYNFNRRSWRDFPLSLSRPIYTNNGKYALIAFKYGNERGEIVN
ncbi:MAG: hypothetical protein ACON5F_09500 [Jejuia sp.]